MIWAWLVRNLERLVEELEFHQIRTGRVVCWIGYRDGRAGEGHATLEAPTDRFDRLLDAFRPCVRRAWIPRAVAQRMHLFAERLVPRLPSQLGLFDGDGRRAEAIATVKRGRRSTREHGRFAVLRGASDPSPLVGIYRDPSNEWDICDVRGKMCF